MYSRTYIQYPRNYTVNLHFYGNSQDPNGFYYYYMGMITPVDLYIYISISIYRYIDI